ncbi:hypothetical protein DAPPUDRAFT_274983 [Daphnia pulex]|uniref:Endonuclease/exonuclease/phosphatase domain-containing protein n=1 Tax=Daphnia pulex TaxID=6669 RepID=E9I4Z9_DAPPU|nr:hypothetical protein DAPPUDRAFT_274983 [Daphnia pulex]|eukprot:EFX60931.1 hypothetical protein DAPPUDRAFT_274983 [Daphnia pulex]
MDDINPAIDSVLCRLKLLTGTEHPSIMLDLSIDIVLIQEPYAISGPSPTLANVPPGYAAFHALSSDHAYGAAILLRQSIADSGRVKLMHKANHSACIEVSSRFGTYRFISLYLRPSLVESKTASYIHPLAQPHLRPVPKVARLDKQLFHKFLGNELSTLSGPLDLTSESSVNLEIDTLTKWKLDARKAAQVAQPISWMSIGYLNI